MFAKPNPLFVHTLSFAFCAAGLGAIQPAFADPVNQCKDATGRTIMTDRPCGDPSVERAAERPPRIVVERIPAEDIFSARNKIQENGAPMPPSPTGDAAKPADRNGGGVF